MAAVNLPNATVGSNRVAPIPDLIPDISLPVIVPPEDETTLQPAQIIPANALDPSSPPFPLNHARILYNNLLQNGAATATGGTNPAYALVPNTYQSWNFTLTTTQTITIELGANTSIDTICLGAHNLIGTTVTAEYDTDLSDPVTLFAPAKTLATNDAVMFHVSDTVTARRVIITISGATGLDYKIGWITGGIALQMARPFFSGHNPMAQNKKHRYYDAWTETGQMVGRSKRSVQLEGDFSWDNLPDDWYREYMPPFIESATRFPYVIAWNLLQYPSDVAMAFTDQDINSSYSGTRDLRSVSFSARGIA